MRSTLKMPKVGDAANEVVIMELLVKVGDTVAEGQNLFTVETDKATLEVPAPFGGNGRRHPDQGRRRSADRRADPGARGLTCRASTIPGSSISAGIWTNTSPATCSGIGRDTPSPRPKIICSAC